MPEDNTKPTPTNNNPEPPAAVEETKTTDLVPSIVEKINEAQNILIALSSDPSVDEMAAAIGLSLFLDKLGKRATAIYSGKTPNALEFLKPEETFESTTDALQDFVIALSKDKADHLRYKLDGDFVKIYITPYKTRISEEDLDYSYGDYNIDLVLALDVANGIDLDSALREHGRIMHDAVIVNITTGNPGKLGEIEWSDKTASSISEMIAKLIYGMNGETKMEGDEATAFLTGIVAATNRFSNAKTSSESMQISSKLMESGANQQLISKNITPEIENELFSNTKELASPKEENKKKSEKTKDDTKLDIKHETEKSEEPSAETSPETTENNSPIEEMNDPNLMDDLKAAEATLSQAGAETTPEKVDEPVKIDSENATMEEPSSQVDNSMIIESPEKVIQPPDNNFAKPLNEFNDNKYGQMLEDALSSINNAPSPNPEANLNNNPAAMNAPTVQSAPEINGVPTMNYLPLPGDETLPPPPTPPIDMSSIGQAAPTTEQLMPPQAETTAVAPVAPISPAVPTPEPTPEPLGPQPAMQDQVYAPQASDPGAFKIPGM